MADLLSSPDPLNDFPTYQSPSKPRLSSRPRRSLPSGGSSPTKQTFELDVGNQLSPQKIRVTVEAGTSDTENVYTHFVEGRRASSPSPVRRTVNRRRERTTTTTVPVKGLSDSEEEPAATPKRGRGRPRKSSGTPVPAKKRGRNSTPVKKATGKRASISALVDDEEDGVELLLGKGVEVGRGNGSSRSRSTKGVARKATPAPKSSEPAERLISSTTSRKGRGRRKTLAPEEVEILEDETGSPVGSNEDLGGPDIGGALSSINVNGSTIPSASSTIRSTTTIGYSEPDITIARFDGMDTPRQTGWSSPRIVDAPANSNSRKQSHNYPSPSNSPERVPSPQNGDDSVALVPLSPERSIAARDEDEFHTKEGDEAGFREFDTILESEGFSMISVDSVPSLRDRLSSPASYEGLKGSTKQARNKKILALQEPERVSNDSFSSIPEDVIEAATPGRKATGSKLLSVPNSRINDSFSSIPPEVLEAATPARKTKASKLLATVNSYMEDSFSSIAPEILEAATPGRELRPTPAPFVSLDRQNNQESPLTRSVFPGASKLGSILSRDMSVSALDSNNRGEPSAHGAQNAEPLHQSNDQMSEPKRLPTPEATPPPLDEAHSNESPTPSIKAAPAPVVAATTILESGNDSTILSQMRSSPPIVAPRRYTYTAHLRQQRDLFPDITQTPSIVFSSPSLPPPIQGPRVYPSASQPTQTQKPKLSPTLRAGRVLQGITVPSSPRVRAQSLGSPFKSPLVERRSSSSIPEEDATSPTQPKRAKPLPRLDLAGNMSYDGSKQSMWSRNPNHEDPFSNNHLLPQRSPSPEEKQGYTLELPGSRRISDPHLASIRSEEDDILGEDEMDWQADEKVSTGNLATSVINQGGSVLDTRKPMAFGQDIANIPVSAISSEQRWAAERAAVKSQIESAKKSEVIVVDSDDDSPDRVGGEDDDFGLLLETLNSSSPAPQQADQPKTNNMEKPRRSKIPSPWRKNSKRLVYNDELSHLSTPIVANALLGRSVVEDTEDSVEMDLSEFVIPQKANFKPRVRERGSLNLSALLAASPEKASLPVLPKSSHFSISQKATSLNNSSTLTSSDDTSCDDELQHFEPIPQKIGFQPSVQDRDIGKSFLFSSPSKVPTPSVKNGIFSIKSNDSTPPDRPTPELTSLSDVQPLGTSSLSRTNAIRVPSFEAQISPSELGQSFDSSILSNGVKENQFIDNRTLKWTETVRLAAPPINNYTSPTKSCLRTPLKTPAARSGLTSNASPSKNVAFVSSSPIPSSPTTEPLSTTTWSRDHWTLLDSILQTWKPENQKEGDERRRRNSIRVISKLLGKNVSCNGEKMKLQQWHLEVVDEFRGRVDGWQEADVAKRVFALLVGERKRGLV